MRCQDLIDELSAPTGEVDRASMARHLAACPRCTAWARQHERFDRLWEATRPELPADAWDRIWSNVTEALDRSEQTPAVPSRAPRSWRRPAVAAFMLAEAAAILVGFLAVLRAPAPPPPQAATVAAAVIPTHYEFQQDQVPLIHLDDQTVLDLASNGSPNAIDPFALPMYNPIESLASLQ